MNAVAVGDVVEWRGELWTVTGDRAERTGPVFVEVTNERGVSDLISQDTFRFGGACVLEAPGMAIPLRVYDDEKRYTARCRCGAVTSILARSLKLSRAPWSALKASDGRYLLRTSQCATWLVVPCRACGTLIDGKPIAGKVKKDVACNAVCTGAKGHSCECSCGGRNHGADHA